MSKATLTHRPTQVRFLRFLVVGGGSALVQLAVLWAAGPHLPENPAFVLSWVISTTTHYLANRFWALPSARHDSGRQLGEYLVTVALSLAINWAAFRLARQVLGLGPLLSALAAIPPSTVVVFLLLNFRVFRARS